MFYPSAQVAAPVCDRTDKFPLHRIDHATQVADIHPLANPASIGTGPPYRLLIEVDESEPAQDGAGGFEGRMAANRCLLHSAQAHMHRAFTLIADLQDSLRSSMNAIQASRQRIEASDRLIARARVLDCE